MNIHIENIIADIKRGNKQAFKKLFDDYYPILCVFSNHYIEDKEVCKDIAQDVLLAYWERKEDFNDILKVKSFLYTVTRNEIFNLFKHQKVEQEYEDKIMKAQLIGDLCDEDTSLLENLYYKEVLLLVKMALDQLPPKRRQIFEMSRFEGLSHKEIAEKLQIPLRTVEDHIYKTLTELRKVLMFVILFRFFP